MTRRAPFLTLFFAAVLCSLFATSVFAAAPDLTPGTGELRFDGTIVSLDANASTLVVSVASFTLPSGKSSVLAAPKPKTIVALDTKIFTVENDAQRILNFADLKVGDHLVIIGKDAGTGKPLPARRIFDAPASTPTAATSAETTGDAPDKNQIVIGAGETRFDGKITGVLSATMLTMMVVSTTGANGETVELDESQNRNVQIGGDTVLRSRQDATHKLEFKDLKVGMRVTLAGKDAGMKTIKAREVALWDDDENKTRSLGTVEISQPVAILLNRADEYQRAHAYDDAAKTYNIALQAAINENDAPGQGMTYNRLGLTYGDLGQPRRSLESFQKALEIWRRVGNSNSEAITQLNLGAYYSEHDDLKSAREAIESAINLYGGGNNRALAIAYNQLGEIQAEQEEPEKAVASWQQALGLARQTQDKDEERSILARLAVGYARLKQPAKSNELLEPLIAGLPQIADKTEAAQTNYMIGMALKYSGQNDKAKDFFTQAQTLYTAAGRRDDADAAKKEIDELGAGEEAKPNAGDDNAAPPEGAVVPAQ